MKRGEIYWAEFNTPIGHKPGDRRPVVAVQSDLFNASALPTVVVSILTTNLRLAKAPGNVLVHGHESGLPSDSVVNVTQLLTIDRSRLRGLVCELDVSLMFSIETGIRLAFDV